jgi:hypothetical protein
MANWTTADIPDQTGRRGAAVRLRDVSEALTNVRWPGVTTAHAT